ncbi:hypothetical protein ANCDUO_15008, partial [Ancylostoma duodenale]
YKLICPDTWPNPRGGTPRDACSKILRYAGLEEDCVYGKTKVFIRSPQTVFRLEELRSAKLPEVVLFLQRHTRGYLARKHYKQKKAVYHIMGVYRRYKLRSYIISVVDSFRGVRQMPDLGKSVRWPAPPIVLAPFVAKLKQMHQRWRAATILARMPEHLRESLPEKLAAFVALNGKRERWGYSRSWKGDYLAQSEEPTYNPIKYRGAMLAMKSSHPYEKVLFSSFFQVSRISVCPEPNGLFIIHVAENDIVGCLKNPKEEERVGELIGVLLAQYERMNARPPTIIVSPALSVCLGGKTRAVRIFPADPTQQAVFKKNGNDIDLICHNMITV